MSELLPTQVNPSVLLLRLGDELMRCRTLLAGIERSFHDVLEAENAAGRPRRWQADIQDIDLLEQTFDDLATCLQAMAGEPEIRAATGVSEARVLGLLKLDGVRRRLHGRPEVRVGADRVELF